MKLHEFKVWPEYFQPIVEGKKTFEIRDLRDRTLTDRMVEVGDWLLLREYDGNVSVREYTGREVTVEVTYIHAGLGMQEGFFVLGFIARWHS